MDRMHKLNSQETAQTLNISDCELMHLRERGGIAYEKRGRAFFYSLPAGHSVLAHPLGQSLLNWYKSKHDFYNLMNLLLIARYSH